MPPEASTIVAVINAASTLFLVGVIWIVQMVHYPYLKFSDPKTFRRAHAFHLSAITPVVAPVMILELATSAWLAIVPPQPIPAWITSAGLALVAAVWISTFAFQVPAHNALSEGYSEERIRSLVNHNWFRTTAWTIKGAIGIYVLFVLASRL